MDDCPPFIANSDLDEVVEIDRDGLRCVAHAHFGFKELGQFGLSCCWERSLAQKGIASVSGCPARPNAHPSSQMKKPGQPRD